MWYSSIILIKKEKIIIIPFEYNLEFRDFKLSRLKTEYLTCWCSGAEWNGGEVTMGGEVLLRVEKFKYLGSIIEENEDIDEDVNHRIGVEWQKWKCAFGVLCDKKIPVWLKESTSYSSKTSFAV